MKVIYKYELSLKTLNNIIEIPYLAKVLCIKEGKGIPCLYALVDKNETRTVELHVVGTGHDIPDNCWGAQYLHTQQYLEGDLVFHLFL